MSEEFDLSETIALRDRLRSDGFLSIESFITEDDVAEVRGLVLPWMDRANQAALPDGVTVSDLGEALPGRDKVVELSNLTNAEPDLSQTRFFRKAMAYTTALLGKGVRFRFDHLIDKSPYNDQATPWHQDCAYSSPVTFSSRKLHWWLPLQPASVENGCMQFVSGSHNRRTLKHESFGLNGSRRRTLDIPDTDIVACPLPVGGVTAHLPRTLHYTGPNTTAERRLAWVVHMGIKSWPPKLL